MAWQVVDRTQHKPDDGDQPVIGPKLAEKIRGFFKRYPSKRAALLPALHVVQESFGYISHRAMRDLAELLEIPPSEVLDTVTFYTHFWQHKRGEKVIMVCRGLSCEMLAAQQVKQAIMDHLGIGEHETTPDGKYSLVTEECIGACEYAPCMLINEKLHKCVRPEDVPEILDDPDNDKLDVPRSDVYDGVKE